MCYKHSAALIMGILKWFSVVVHSDKYTIEIRDHEFVGEDPVLAGELARRMAVGPELGSLPALQLLDHHVVAQDRREVALDVTTSGDQTNIGRRRQEDRLYKAYINQPNDGVIENFAVKMIEQAIYSVQYRLNEIDHYVRRYDRDVRFRIAYILKLMIYWLSKSHIAYVFITRKEKLQMDTYNVWKNLIYYSQMLKMYTDITYTRVYLFKLHTDFVKNGSPQASAHHRPSLEDMHKMKEDMNMKDDKNSDLK